VSTRQFGEKVQRREDPRLLTGNGRYLDDLGHTALEAAFVRSPHAHARIRSIDTSAARALPGVLATLRSAAEANAVRRRPKLPKGTRCPCR
jgi:carbon-monoxide dehydrogenase large subunit